MTESKPKTRRFFSEHPKFGFFVQELNPGIDPTKLAIRSGKPLTLKCPDCRHVYSGTAHGLKNCRFCVHQELCDSDDCEMCFRNSLASRHFASVGVYKQFKSLYESGAEYASVVALFLETCAIYDFRNNLVSCRSVFKSTHKEALFICRKCDHVFPNSPCHIASLIDCPFCSPANAKMLCPKEKECSKCFVKSFASHSKSEFWDYSEGRNGGKTPHDVFVAGSYLADFVCGECEHQFQASCNNVSTGFWCPFCAGQKRCGATDCDLCNGRKLSSHPMANFWDGELNPKDITPADISLGNSRNLYWFKCPAGRHPSFQKRASKISGGCPHCINKTEAKLYEYLRRHFADVQPQFRPDWCKNPTTNCHLPFDFYIPTLKVIIELDGAQHFRQVANWTSHMETQKRDVYKMMRANAEGYTVIRLAQEDVLEETDEWLNAKLLPFLKLNEAPEWVVLSKNEALYAEHQRLLELGELPTLGETPFGESSLADIRRLGDEEEDEST